MKKKIEKEMRFKAQNQENRQFIALMQKVAITACIVAFLACLLTACKPIHDVRTEYVDRYVHDSVLVEKIDTIIKVKEHRDSVVLRDSVFVNVWQSADTIFKIKEVWKYRDRVSVKHDTIKDVQIDVQYQERIDTAYINKEVVKTEYKEKSLSWWQTWWVGSGIGAWIFIIGLFVTAWLRKKVNK